MTTKEKVKALWQLCFDDSEEFVEMYFRLRYKNEINVTIESGDEVISALQMIPYPMTFVEIQYRPLMFRVHALIRIPRKRSDARITFPGFCTDASQRNAFQYIDSC